MVEKTFSISIFLLRHVGTLQHSFEVQMLLSQKADIVLTSLEQREPKRLHEDQLL
jgi:hypothetical protein